MIRCFFASTFSFVVVKFREYWIGEGKIKLQLSELQKVECFFVETRCNSLFLECLSELVAVCKGSTEVF